jgi:hypothetical protein
VRERVRPPNRHQEVPGTRLDAPQVDIVGRQELEFVKCDAGALGLGRDRSPGTEQSRGQHCDQGEAGERGRVARRREPTGGEDQEGRRADETDRPLASADGDIQRRPVGARLGADRAISDERRQLEDRRNDDSNRITAGDP